jgi:hypothetical protein
MSQYQKASRWLMIGGCRTPAATKPAPDTAITPHECSHFRKREQAYYQLFFGVTRSLPGCRIENHPKEHSPEFEPAQKRVSQKER